MFEQYIYEQCVDAKTCGGYGFSLRAGCMMFKTMREPGSSMSSVSGLLAVCFQVVFIIKFYLRLII